MLQNAIRVSFFSFFLITNFAFAQNKSFDVSSFDSVVISPHIEVIFQKGSTASVVIESSREPMDKVNVEVEKNTLSIYLDDARVITKNKKERRNGHKMKKPIYKGTVVKALVTYTDLNELDLRGEERFLFKSEINAEKFILNIYGASQVTMNKVILKNLQASIYGESVLEIKAGTIQRQKFTAYGETTINTQEVASKETKLTAYGEGSFQVNVEDRLKVTAYGEATIVYKGNPNVDKGIVIGEAKIVKKSSI